LALMEKIVIIFKFILEFNYIKFSIKTCNYAENLTVFNKSLAQNCVNETFFKEFFDEANLVRI
jgi:hypothetical protein